MAASHADFCLINSKCSSYKLPMAVIYPAINEERMAKEIQATA
jgi:hypothetical protein